MQGQRLESPKQAPQALSLLPMQLPEWISQVRDPPLLGTPRATDRSLDRAEDSSHLWVFAFPLRSTWWSPTLPTHGQIHSCNCAKLLCRDVHRSSVCNSENQMQTAC